MKSIIIISFVMSIFASTADNSIEVRIAKLKACIELTKLRITKDKTAFKILLNSLNGENNHSEEFYSKTFDIVYLNCYDRITLPQAKKINAKDFRLLIKEEAGLIQLKTLSNLFKSNNTTAKASFINKMSSLGDNIRKNDLLNRLEKKGPSHHWIYPYRTFLIKCAILALIGIVLLYVYSKKKDDKKKMK